METQSSDTKQLFVTWQNSMHDGYRHAITDEEFAFGSGRYWGRFAAVCSDRVSLGDSFVAPYQRCPRCVAVLLARSGCRRLSGHVVIVHRSLVEQLLSMLCPHLRHAR